MKTFYKIEDGKPCVFEDDANISDWPGFSETPVVVDPLHPLERRLILLAETDWWAMSDRTMTAAQTQYRQDLRDIPDQAGFPDNVIWPTMPDV